MSPRRLNSNVPYAQATTGITARGEIVAILRRFKCENIGFMDIDERHELLLAFKHRGRDIQLRASAQGWAALWLKNNPWNGLRKASKREYEERAMQQGQIAINSILRDWVKGQVMAVETGMLSFEAVFMPFMLTSDGKTMIERMQQTGVLPAPTE